MIDRAKNVYGEILVYGGDPDTAEDDEYLTDYFDPTVYPLVRLWGLQSGAWNNAEYHESLPSQAEIAETMKHVGLDKIDIETSNGKYYIYKRDAQVMIDLGAQAKGYATDRLCEKVRARSELISAIFNVSGNVQLVGGVPDYVKYRDVAYYKGTQSAFSIRFTDPYDPYGSVFGYLTTIFGYGVEDRSAVTSGDYERRFWFVDGLENGKGYSPIPVPERNAPYYCHIVSPKTGMPCNIKRAGERKYVNVTENCLTSVSLLLDRGEDSDVYATAMMLMGMDKSIGWMERADLDGILLGLDYRYACRTDFGALLDADKDTFAIEEMRNKFEPFAPEYAFPFSEVT